MCFIATSKLNVITAGDDNYQQVALGFSFPFFKTNYNQVSISTNGFIFFSTIDPLTVSGSNAIIGAYSAYLSNSILAYNYDFYTLNGGLIYYQSFQGSSSVMSIIQADVNTLLTNSANFVPQNAFIITYDNVASSQATYFDGTSINGALGYFQIILTTDMAESYVILNYATCLKADSFSPGLPHTSINCVSNLNTIVERIFTNPCGSSNVNVPAKWIFSLNSDCKNLIF